MRWDGTGRGLQQCCLGSYAAGAMVGDLLTFGRDTLLVRETYVYHPAGQLTETFEDLALLRSDAIGVQLDGIADRHTLLSYTDGKTAARQVYAASGALLSDANYAYADGRLSTQSIRTPSISMSGASGPIPEIVAVEVYSYDAHGHFSRIARSRAVEGSVISQCEIVLSYNPDGTRASQNGCGNQRVFLNGDQCTDPQLQRDAAAQLGLAWTEASVGTNRLVIMQPELEAGVFRPQR